MKKVWERYARWTYRSAGSAQCSPALAVLGMVAACGIVIYVYRELILRTIEIAALVALTVILVAVAAAVTVSTIRWYRKRTPAPALEPEVVAGQALAGGSLADAMSVSAEADRMATSVMHAEADWIAADEVNLAVGPDGKLLVQDATDTAS